MVKKNQNSEKRNFKESLKEGEVFVWMDFAKNFNYSSIKEFKSAY